MEAFRRSFDLKNGNDLIMKGDLCCKENTNGSEGDVSKGCSMPASPPCVQGYSKVFQKCMQVASSHETGCTLIPTVDVPRVPPSYARSYT